MQQSFQHGYLSYFLYLLIGMLTVECRCKTPTDPNKPHITDTIITDAMIQEVPELWPWLKEVLKQLKKGEKKDINTLAPGHINDGMAALHQAVCAQKLNIIKVLLDNGANINIKDKIGMPPLYWAISFQNLDIVELLIDKGADKNQIDNTQKRTPLSLAIERNNPAMVKLLLQKGANPNIPDKDGYTALHQAVIITQVEIVDLLLQHGANKSAKTYDYDQTPLNIANVNKTDSSKQAQYDAIIKLLSKP